MSEEQKGLGTKIKRLFLEEDEEAAPGTAAEQVTKIAQEANLQPPPPPQAPAAPAPDARLDFPGIYRAAGLSEEDLEQVERAEKLLRTLPANLPLETQKQILEGTLKTFGVDPGRIRQTLQRQQRALAAYVTVFRQDTEKRDGEARARIEALRAEAARLERSVEERARARASVEQACKAQGDAVGRVAGFLPPPAESK